jgi:hypothetical protein
MDATTYPAWQKAIREAQAITEARIAEENAREEAEERRKQAEKDAKLAGALKKALAHFGIEAEPTSNRWDVDEFVFSLSEHSAYNVRPVQRYEGARKPDSVPVEEYEAAYFALNVRHKDIEALSDDYDDYFGARLHETVTVQGQRIDGDWTGWQAGLAYCLDSIQRSAEEERQRKENRVLRASQTPEYPPEPTKAEQLEELIRAIVREQRYAEDY